MAVMLILGIAAAAGSAWVIHSGTDNWLVAVGLTLFAWAFGAAAVYFGGSYIGLTSHFAIWGMIIGCSAMALVFMKQ